MKLASTTYPAFQEAAIEAIALRVTQLINNLATHCLLYGFQMKKVQIDDEIFWIAAEEIEL